MRYMVLVYDCQREFASAEEATAKRTAVAAYVRMLRERGVYRAADALLDTDTATTVRVRDGETLITDGPYAETREWLGGVFVLECHDLDEALELAAACPMAAEGGMEVRPVMPTPELHDPVDRLTEAVAE